MSGPPQIGIVVLQPTAFCNINCSYCYLPDRDNKHMLAQSTVTRLFTELFASGWAAPQLTVIWHAGEPLVAPVPFYREAFATRDPAKQVGLVPNEWLAALCPTIVLDDREQARRIGLRGQRFFGETQDPGAVDGVDVETQAGFGAEAEGDDCRQSRRPQAELPPVHQ